MQRLPSCPAATAGFYDLSVATPDRFSCSFSALSPRRVAELRLACLSTITDQLTPPGGKLKAPCQHVNQ